MFCGSCGTANPDTNRFCRSCGRSLAADFAAAPADALDARATVMGLRAGQILSDRHVLERLLGRGGMGEVWLARDRTLDLPVAIKVVSELLARDAQAMARLRVEARTTIPLHHPRIVRVNHFENQGPVTFLVMEYIEGETLAQRLARERQLPEVDARRIGLAVTEALAYAHEHRVLHRDIKPANVLLGVDGAVKLADFGIARAATDSLSRLTGLQTSGTLLYMAPEVVEGEPPLPAADWYSLGATLYELVTGMPPFHSGDLTYQILHKTPTPLEGVSAVFGALVATLLAKNPAARPAATEIRETLSGTFGRRQNREAQDSQSGRGPDVVIEHPIDLTLEDAFTGTIRRVLIPHEGRQDRTVDTAGPTSLKVPESTRSGGLPAKSLGMPTTSRPDERGDLHVTTDVAVPSLSDGESRRARRIRRALIAALALAIAGGSLYWFYGRQLLASELEYTLPQRAQQRMPQVAPAIGMPTDAELEAYFREMLGMEVGRN